MILLLGATVISCSIDEDSESPWEMQLRDDLQAESVKFSEVDMRMSGVVSNNKRNWRLVIINSKALKYIMGNERRVLEKCNEIKGWLLINQHANMRSADTLHIVLIQSSNFFIFHSIHHKTITYPLHAQTRE